MQRLLTALFLVAVSVVLSSNSVSLPLSAADNGHLSNRLFTLQFIEDPPAEMPVYDCGPGHSHPTITQDAIDNLNATGFVNFAYKGTTLCDATGFPLIDDAISVFHHQNINTADILVRTYVDTFRLDDIGLEGDVGMRRIRIGRIRIKTADSPPCVPDPDPPCNTFDSHDQWAMGHELGHAAALADLYVEGSDPCVDGHPHAAGDTIMDCSPFHNPGPHDIANLELLYKNPPTLVNDFAAVDTTYEPDGTATVSFAWTDRSYNEKFQFVAMDNDENYIAEDTLVAFRDDETLVWPGLTPGTRYCFFIQSLNAYLVAGPVSGHTCIDTPPEQAGVYDMLVHWPGQPYNGFFHCIVKVNHGPATDELTTAQQCNTDLPGLGEASNTPPTWEDTCETLAGRNPPECVAGDLSLDDSTEGGADSVPGPPPPPPYTLQGPSTSTTGTFYIDGSSECGTTPCDILYWCFQETGAPCLSKASAPILSGRSSCWTLATR